MCKCGQSYSWKGNNHHNNNIMLAWWCLYTITRLEMVIKQLPFSPCDFPYTFNAEHWCVQYPLPSRDVVVTFSFTNSIKLVLTTVHTHLRRRLSFPHSFNEELSFVIDQHAVQHPSRQLLVQHSMTDRQNPVPTNAMTLTHSQKAGNILRQCTHVHGPIWPGD